MEVVVVVESTIVHGGRVVFGVAVVVAVVVKL